MERNYEFLMDLVKQVKRDMDNLNIPYDNSTPISLNNRLTRALGRCKYRTDDWDNERYAYSIEIQTQYFLTGDIQDIKNTICHELIHSSCLYDGHNGKWKVFAEIMNNNTNYNIHRLSRVKYDKGSKETGFKYEAYCPKCGVSWKRKSKCKLILHPEQYSHTRCGCSLKSRAI